MDNNFENNNSFSEENGSENSVPNAEKAGNTFEQGIGYEQQNGTESSQQYSRPQGSGVPPFTPPPYSAYCDTNSGYIPYGAYPQKKQAEKTKSKNKKLGIAVAAVLTALSLTVVSIIAVYAAKSDKIQSGKNNTKVEAEIPLADSNKDTVTEGSAQAIYQKAYESNVGVIVYSKNQSTIASEGSGVVLPTVISGGDSSKTYIVTCAHVLET